MKRRLTLTLTVVLLVLFGWLAANPRPATYFPLVAIDATPPQEKRTKNIAAVDSLPLTLTFLFNSVATQQKCEAITGNVARVTLANCPFCSVKQLTCKQALAANEELALSEAPLPGPSGRTANGVVLFSSENANLAESACRQSQQHSSANANPISCFPAGTARPLPQNTAVTVAQLGYSAIVFLVALIAAWSCGWLIVKYEHLHAAYSHDHVDAGPQKFHTTPTPRIGGLAVAVGLVAAGAVMILVNDLTYEREFGLLLLAGIPAFLGGLVEDVTKKVGVMERLLLTILSGAVAAWLLGGVLTRLEIPLIDQALLAAPIAVAFTIFSVGGVANAVNIIDGYNGLASGFAVIVLSAIALVAGQHGDMFILAAALALAGAVLGFFHWNWPRGRIFFGDGGAYLVGFMLAEISVLLVVRNHGVSPWFPLLLLIYPVFETIFSIYRRRLRHGISPGQPDSRHLHQLVYRCITLPNESRISHNSRVAIRLLAPALVVAAVAVALHGNHHRLLIAVAAVYCLFYLTAYEWFSRRAKKSRKRRKPGMTTDKARKSPSALPH